MPHEAFKVTFFSVASTAVLSLILVYPMGYNGLALAPGIAFTASGILGLYYVKRKLGKPLNIINMNLIGNYLFALMIMDIAVMLYRFVWPYSTDARILIRSVWILGVVAAGACSYAIVTAVMKFEEWKLLRQAFMKK